MSRQFFQFDKKITDAAGRALELCAPQLTYTEEIQEYHQQKMLYAFQKAGVSESHFVSSTGYGYGDRGRDALDEVFATVFEAEDALVRHNFVSGTHALAVRCAAPWGQDGVRYGNAVRHAARRHRYR